MNKLPQVPGRQEKAAAYPGEFGHEVTAFRVA